MRRFITSSCFFLLCVEATAVDWSGHIKYQPLVSFYPDDSYFREIIDSPAIDNNLDARLKLGWQKNQFQFNVDYQLLGKSGDSVEFYSQASLLETLQPFFPDDSRRVMDLTDYIIDEADAFLVQRLDRLNFTWTSHSTVIKLGRQAISWGNGVIFNPMDLFNPFDPAAVDKEYKTGDDMLYGQGLMANGDDVQFVWVGRRDQAGEVSSDANSIAVKYHGFISNFEYDLLLAQHYDDSVFGIGLIGSLGGSVMRTDLVVEQTDEHTLFSTVVNWSYSWVGWQKNMSGSLEYYRNGAGISNGQYDPLSLQSSEELIRQLARGQTYNLGRDYLAGSVTIEMHPLWLLTPTLFYNLNDHSVMLQTSSSHDLKQNVQLLLALNIPLGSRGTEYGGIDIGIDDQYLSLGASLFGQLAWYF